MSSRRPDIFFSLRFNATGPMKEANLLQAELAKFNVNAAIINVESGKSIEKEVIRTLDQSKLAVLFATSDYGVEGTVNFSTHEELAFILQEKKPFFLIKMCDRYDDPVTRFRLPGAIAYVDWRIGQPMPSELVAKVLARFESEGGVASVGALAASLASAASVSSSLERKPAATPSPTPAPAPAPVVKPVAFVTATATVVNKPVATVAASQTVSSGKARDIKIVSASNDKTIKIWEVSASSGQFGNTSTLTGHTRVRLSFSIN